MKIVLKKMTSFIIVLTIVSIFTTSLLKCYTERAVDKHPKIW